MYIIFFSNLFNRTPNTPLQTHFPTATCTGKLSQQPNSDIKWKAVKWKLLNTVVPSAIFITLPFKKKHSADFPHSEKTHSGPAGQCSQTLSSKRSTSQCRQLVQRDFLYSSFGGFGLRVSPGQLLLIGLEMHHIAGEQCRWTGGKIWGKTHKWTESWITRKWGKSFFGTKTTGLNIRYARDMPSISIQYRPNYFNYSSLVAKLPLKHFRLITNGSGHTEICIQIYFIKSLY